MKKTKKNWLNAPLLLALAIVGYFLFPQPTQSPNLYNQENYQAQITGVLSETIQDDTYIQEIEVKFTNGPQEGSTTIIVNDESYSMTHREFQAGDQVMVTYNIDQDFYFISDYIRGDALFWLFAAFVSIVIAVTGWQGIGSLIGMFLSFIVIFRLVLPQILSGGSPVLAAILGSIFIIPLTFYSSHGFNKKTTVAVISTFVTLVLSGILATVFADAANLTGLASEEIIYLQNETAQTIDFRGLVLAGMIISILGVLDDITISQASVVSQLKAAKKSIKFGELLSRAMAVGRDHIASLVNTLILVYTGASLPLLILFIDSSQKFSEIINYEFMAEEIVRTLIGSIGLVLAVPITSFLAALIIKKGSNEPSHCCH